MSSFRLVCPFPNFSIRILYQIFNAKSRIIWTLLKIVLDNDIIFCYNNYMKKSNNKWTVRQHGLLKRFYGEVTIEELSTMLEKSKSAIYSKVHYLRKRGWSFKWTLIEEWGYFAGRYKDQVYLKKWSKDSITSSQLHEEETPLTLPNAENGDAWWKIHFLIARIVYISTKIYDEHSHKNNIDTLVQTAQKVNPITHQK